MAQKGWNFNVARCVGCSACAIACKAENNTYPTTSPTNMEALVVGNGRPVVVNYREVETIDSGTYPRPVRVFVSMACNHCASPACLASCPVEPKAIAKDGTTGLVQISQEKCIGCRYCEAACPYGAPQFNVATNKVEKCTGCKTRVDAGLKPACVTTCVGKALTWVEATFVGDHGTVPPGFAATTLTEPSIKFVDT
jgi:Fe-S-cluster-containing dehydrogenase component